MSVFRNVYRQLSVEEAELVVKIKEKADELLLLMQGNITLTKNNVDFIVKVDPRMVALARTKLEESVMWSVKSITG